MAYAPDFSTEEFTEFVVYDASNLSHAAKRLLSNLLGTLTVLVSNSVYFSLDQRKAEDILASIELAEAIDSQSNTSLNETGFYL